MKFQAIKYIDGSKYRNIYTVGDLHGSYTLLMQSLQKLQFDFEKDLLISVGDLVDRGKENIKCIELLDKKWFVAVRGNHENFCIQGFNDSYIAHIHSLSNNGGCWFYSLSETTQKNIVSQFENLPYIIELKLKNEKIGFVHANVPDVHWEKLKQLVEVDKEQPLGTRTIRSDIIWNRDLVYQENPKNILGIDRVYLGHTIVDSITQKGNCFFIDTGANLTQKLTIVKL